MNVVREGQRITSKRQNIDKKLIFLKKEDIRTREIGFKRVIANNDSPRIVRDLSPTVNFMKLLKRGRLGEIAFQGFLNVPLVTTHNRSIPSTRVTLILLTMILFRHPYLLTVIVLLVIIRF